jgi:hypothetical protein
METLIEPSRVACFKGLRKHKSIVGHDCSLSYLGGRECRIMVLGWPGTKVNKTTPQQARHTWYFLLVTLALWEA